MTSFNSSLRHLLGNGRPCWLNSQVALPHLLLLPLPDGQWEVRALVGGLWGIAPVSLLAGIEGVLAWWERDPEEFCQEVFNMPPPTGTPRAWEPPASGPSALVASKSAEDLGL